LSKHFLQSGNGEETLMNIEPSPMRRLVLLAGLVGSAMAPLLGRRTEAGTPAPPRSADHAAHSAHGGMATVGEVDHSRNGFDPHTVLTTQGCSVL
jgi:hypothetical protein